MTTLENTEGPFLSLGDKVTISHHLLHLIGIHINYLSTTNSSPSLSPPQNPSPNQIAHELHHLSNLLEINLQQAIDATNPSPPTSPCIPPPSLDQ
ncbi:hypothetical protein Tco_1089134, partial [Tanacetum coccineum]